VSFWAAVGDGGGAAVGDGGGAAVGDGGGAAVGRGWWCTKAVWANRGDDHKERRSAGAQERRSAGAQMCRCADVQMCRCAERRFGPTEAMITMSCRADVRPNRIAQDSAG
jgi:hypothetical protein